MKHIVVVGSGLGGLAAAVRLLQRDFRVTLIEKEPRVGGYAIGYRRQGYDFDLALHVIPSAGSGQEFSLLLDRLNISKEVESLRLAHGFKVFLGNYHFQMPNNLQKLLVTLADQFPKEERGIQRFHRDLVTYLPSYAPLFSYGIPLHKALPKFLLRLPSFLKNSNLPTKSYLDRFFKDDRLKAILFQPAAFMGIGMERLPTINFLMMFYLLLNDGMYTIKGGGQALSKGLERKFRHLGGELRLNTQAEKFILKNKKVVAITTSSGQELACDGVIAGNSLYDVVERLVGRSSFSKSYLDTLDNLQPSVSVMALNLGLDCHPRELGIENHISMVFPDADLDVCFTRQKRFLQPLAYSVTAQGNSESDGHGSSNNTLSIIGGTAPKKWLEMNSATYTKAKSRITQNIIQTVADKFPALPKHIVVSDLATPRSMQRYTGNPLGAIMGFDCTVGSHRKLIQVSRLPIKNVSMGSAWTHRLGGFMQSLKSGILAAEQMK